MKSGYIEAIRLGFEKLSELNPEIVCSRTGCKYVPSLEPGIRQAEYHIPWLGEKRALSSGNQYEQILWLHYLTSEGTKHPTGKLIAYRDIPGALFYESKFEARVVRPIVKCFGNNLSDLTAAGEKLTEKYAQTADQPGVKRASFGDASVTIDILPYVPVTYIIWSGDDEMCAAGNVLFDETAAGWLSAEDLVVLASLGVYRLIELSKSLTIT